MRFVPYEQLGSAPNIIVDGAATKGTLLTLSHWPKSGTPAGLKRDTSAEIAFAYLDSPQFHVAADAVSNNHFDEDGLVGVFVLTNPAAAQRQRALLIDVATAGDFGVYKQREAARIALALAAMAEPETSPLPRELFALPYPQLTGGLYSRLLEIFPDLISHLDRYQQYWQAEDERLRLSEDLIRNGAIKIEERLALDLAIVTVPPDIFVGQAHPHQCHLLALHSRTPCSRMLLMQGEHVEFQYRYESWVQFVSRRPPARVDLSPLAEELNREESSGARWIFDGVDRITPRLHLEGDAATSLRPGVLESRLEDALRNGAPAWNPYD